MEYSVQFTLFADEVPGWIFVLERTCPRPGERRSSPGPARTQRLVASSPPAAPRLRRRESGGGGGGGAQRPENA